MRTACKVIGSSLALRNQVESFALSGVEPETGMARDLWTGAPPNAIRDHCGLVVLLDSGFANGCGASAVSGARPSRVIA